MRERVTGSASNLAYSAGKPEACHQERGRQLTTLSLMPRSCVGNCQWCDWYLRLKASGKTFAKPGTCSINDTRKPCTATTKANSCMTQFNFGSCDDNLLAAFNAAKLSDLTANSACADCDHLNFQVRAATTTANASQMACQAGSPRLRRN